MGSKLTIIVAAFLAGAVCLQTIKSSRFFTETSFLNGSMMLTISTRSIKECAHRCLTFHKAKGFLYKEQHSDNCLVIQFSNSGGQTFLPQDGSRIFKVQLFHEIKDPTNPVVYFHFEEDQSWTNHGAEIVMEETPFTLINTVVKTDHTMQQWLHLGNQSQACITIPETCGIQGGTLSAWIKVGSCQTSSGIISSMTQLQTSFSVLCIHSDLRYVIDEVDGFYNVHVIDTTTDWVHGVLVYHGVGQGITAYHDGSKIGTDLDKHLASRKQKGNGQVVIGKRTGRNGDLFASGSVDEIKFYNRQLSEQEISNMYRRI